MLLFVRSIFVFSPLRRAEMEAMLDELLPQQRNPWVMASALYVNIVDEVDGLLFTDWEDKHVAAVETAMGARPGWAIQVDISGRIDGTAEVVWLAGQLLSRGGVATDDYTDHCWTREQIEARSLVEGLRFFDYQTYHRRERPTEPGEQAWPQDASKAHHILWPGIQAALPIGTHVVGTVIGRQPFGVFVRIDHVPGAVGLAEIAAMPTNQQLPPVGTTVTGEVVWHAEHNRQIKIRLTEWTTGLEPKH